MIKKEINPKLFEETLEGIDKIIGEALDSLTDLCVEFKTITSDERLSEVLKYHDALNKLYTNFR